MFQLQIWDVLARVCTSIFILVCVIHADSSVLAGIVGTEQISPTQGLQDVGDDLNLGLDQSLLKG